MLLHVTDMAIHRSFKKPKWCQDKILETMVYGMKSSSSDHVYTLHRLKTRWNESAPCQV